MKFLRAWVGVILLLGVTVLAFPSSVAAQLGTYGSSFQVQNLSENQATITIEFYDSATGTVVGGATINDTIAGNGSKTYFAVTISGLSSGFSGSAVISSSEPIRAVHNLDVNNFQYGASSSGYNEGALTVNLPLIMRNNSGYTTWFSVQNAGTVATDVTVEFIAGSAGSNHTTTPVTIQPGASYRFEQADATQLGSPFVGSAVVTSSAAPVVATVVEVGPDTLYAYDGFVGGSTNVIAPLFQYYNAGFSSSMQVQNTGDAATTVTLTYTPSAAGTACQETQTIQPGGAGTFGLAAFAQAGNDCFDKNPNTQFIGSVEVTNNTASQPLVAIVNQHNFTTGKGAAYSAFSPDDATQCTSLPLIMDRNSNYWTGISFVNIGSTTNVTIDYSDVTAPDETFQLAAGESDVRLHNGAIADGYVGSATICGANASDQILAIVNEQNLVAPGDTFLVYNGFNY